MLSLLLLFHLEWDDEVYYLSSFENNMLVSKEIQDDCQESNQSIISFFTGFSNMIVLSRNPCDNVFRRISRDFVIPGQCLK